jgi:ribosomal protein S18 acetylase RimI-like enzyme
MATIDNPRPNDSPDRDAQLAHIPLTAAPWAYLVGDHCRMHPIRTASPADYDAIAPVIDEWWGRPILGSLPRLFLDLFCASSLIIDGADGPDAFLIGILSPSEPGHAYIHFVGVAPHARRRGYGRLLYEEFFRRAKAAGRNTVSAITAPVNLRSAEFHRALGFTVSGPVAGYNGPGHEMLVFDRAL